MEGHTDQGEDLDFGLDLLHFLNYDSFASTDDTHP